LPEVKRFLKGFEAEEYENIEVQYIHGRKPVLTIFEDGVQKEEVALSTFKQTSDLHSMMVTKGFIRKSEEAITRMKNQKLEGKRVREAFEK